MEPIDQFKNKEADKLADWVSQTLALKEAKVHTNDAMAAIGQRAQVEIQTNTLEDTPTPPIPISEATSGRNSGRGLTEERVREIVQEMLEGYATEEWVKDQGYATEEWVEDQGYATEEWVEDQGYATEEWVQEQLEDYATKDWVEDKLVGLATEDWVEDHFVNRDKFFCNWNRAWLDNFGETGFGDAVSEIAGNVAGDMFQDLGITATCENGNITVELTGLPDGANSNASPFFVGDDCPY
jgi:hypothetical protein